MSDRSGAEVLDRLLATLRRFVVMPSDHAAHAIVLWIAATHAVEEWAHATRLVIKSPEKRCGKSRLLDIIEGVCFRALITVNASPAAVYRSIGADGPPPTLLVDESDSIFGTVKGSSEGTEELRGLLNAGFGRNRPALRVVGVGTAQTVQPFPTFAMAALAGIGDLPDTIEDRAVVVTMRRRGPGESVEPYRERTGRPLLDAHRDALAEWVESVRDTLADAEPALPVEDRAADVWEPLVAVADAARGEWPARARAAAVALTSAASADDQSEGVRLLADLRDVFAAAPLDALRTDQVVAYLRGLDESPWAAANLNANGLARRLRPFGVKPGRLPREHGTRARGYRAAELADTFARYLTPADPAPWDPVPDPGYLFPAPDPSQPSHSSQYGIAAGQDPPSGGTGSEVDPSYPVPPRPAGTGGTTPPEEPVPA